MSNRRTTGRDALLLRISGNQSLYPRLFAKYSSDQIGMMMRQSNVHLLHEAEEWCAATEKALQDQEPDAE